MSIVKNNKMPQSKKSVKKKSLNGPPLKAETFSENWKKFLEQKKIEPSAEKKMDRKLVKNSLTQKHSNQSTSSSLQKKRKRFPKKETTNEEGQDDIWFDVDPALLPKKYSKINSGDTESTGLESCISDAGTQHSEINDNTCDKKENKPSTDQKITRYVALDCEMVGVGIDGKESVLARVSLVNSVGECIYDKYVAPKEKVIDYRTHVSGISPQHLKNAVPYDIVQKEVCDILKGRILVGHALQNDLKVLMLSHSRKNIRDTQKYKPFQKLLKRKRPSLKMLAKEILQQNIQEGSHDSVTDAQVTMQIYRKYKKDWEKALHTKKKTDA